MRYIYLNNVWRNEKKYLNNFLHKMMRSTVTCRRKYRIVIHWVRAWTASCKLLFEIPAWRVCSLCITDMQDVWMDGKIYRVREILRTWDTNSTSGKAWSRPIDPKRWKYCEYRNFHTLGRRVGQGSTLYTQVWNKTNDNLVFNWCKNPVSNCSRKTSLHFICENWSILSWANPCYKIQ